MQSLTFDATSTRVEEPINLFAGKAPCIKHLNIHSLPFNWHPETFRKLEKLTLTGITGKSMSLPLSYILNLGSLQHLHLERVHVVNDADPGVVYALQQAPLKSFQVINVPFEPAGELVSRVSWSPSLTSVSISWWMPDAPLADDQYTASLDLLCAWILPAMNRIAESEEDLGVMEVGLGTPEHDLEVVAAYPTGGCVTIKIRNNMPSLCAFRWFRNLVREHTTCRRISLDVCAGLDWRRPEIYSLLDGLNISAFCLTRFAHLENDIEGRGIDVQQGYAYFLDRFEKPIMDGDNSRWMLPNLDELVVITPGEISTERFLEAMRRRYRRSPSLAGPPAPPSVPRIELMGQTVDTTHAQQIVDLLGSNGTLVLRDRSTGDIIGPDDWVTASSSEDEETGSDDNAPDDV